MTTQIPLIRTMAGPDYRSTYANQSTLQGHRQRITIALALATTMVSLVLSVCVAWQRGSTLTERGCAIALGVILVLCTHLLPGITAGLGARWRWLACLLWAGCGLVTLYSHATFVLQAQARVSEKARAEAPATPQLIEPVNFTPTRGLAQIAAEETQTHELLARLSAQRCEEPCTWLNMRRNVLNSKIKALAQEMEDVRRWQSAQDRLVVLADRERDLRDSQSQEPVLLRLANVTGISIGLFELWAALLMAVVIEGVACLLWYVWMQGSRATGTPTSTTADCCPSSAHQSAVTVSPDRPVTDDNDAGLLKARKAIADGTLALKVTDIRLFLRCAQKNATRIHRQLTAERNGGSHPANGNPATSS